METKDKQYEEYLKWKERCFKEFKSKIEYWNELTNKNVGYAGDFLSGAFMYDYFNPTVKDICEWIVTHKNKCTESMIDLAEKTLVKHGK